MFPTLTRDHLAQRTLGAIRAVRSFLLLEDDHDVDWEVDRDEPAREHHPHRASLRMRRHARRAGAMAPPCHVCLSPLERLGTLHCRAHARQEQAGGRKAWRDKTPACRDGRGPLEPSG